ncbi:hypothetical protein B0T21DRAFT_47715 [Apiosordaria backusii]|uniref:Uncharacterized protein n=1 Tax=Apiosordaria backusii TaxID=314023 RepID=A0AA40AXU1_9PEZI|nr:hypothetical protein B0T21DRAFT_47715 [Apiosordaria backusii]
MGAPRLKLHPMCRYWPRLPLACRGAEREREQPVKLPPCEPRLVGAGGCDGWRLLADGGYSRSLAVSGRNVVVVGLYFSEVVAGNAAQLAGVRSHHLKAGKGERKATAGAAVLPLQARAKRLEWGGDGYVGLSNDGDEMEGIHDAVSTSQQVVVVYVGGSIWCSKGRLSVNRAPKSFCVCVD